MTSRTASLGAPYEPILKKLVEKAVSQVSTVGEQKGKTQEHANEEIIVAPTEAVHNPDAVMIMFCHTDVAYPAMLASRWFDQLASLADLSRLEKDMVVGVLPHVSVMGTRGNYRRNGFDGSIGHYVLYGY